MIKELTKLQTGQPKEYEPRLLGQFLSERLKDGNDNFSRSWRQRQMVRAIKDGCAIKI